MGPWIAHPSPGSFGPVVKEIFYFWFWWPFCSAKQNSLCNFGRGHYEEHFCDIILNLDQGLGCHLRYFLFLFVRLI